MLELAARLRGLPRPELATALQAREFDASGVRDLFDLAEVLLAPDSIDHALSRLDRRHLAVLAAASEIADEHGDTTVDAVHGQLKELGASDAWKPLLEAGKRGNLTLIYSAHDPERNGAVVLRDFLMKKVASKAHSRTA